MFRLAKPVLAAVLIALSGASAFAADYVEPPVVEAPPPEPVADFGGWYIRGDVDYHWADFRGSDYITYGACCVDPGSNSLGGDVDSAFSLGGGIGYQITNYLRTDLTADYWFNSDFTGSTTGTNGVSTDSSSFSSWLLLANAYADLGTYYGFTPYVGAGIGGAHIKWDDLHNTIGPDTTVHEGDENWRFAWALMAGTAYCLTDNLKLDVGYRFSRINGGRMFELASVTGPGFDDGFNVHEARAGLRYQFGGDTGCGAPPAPYEPEPVTPVYK
jgi:opacity protein-like surface antigen